MLSTVRNVALDGHTPIFACGDPRNIALIGHWDGWQPFGYSGSQSCGKYYFFHYLQ